MYEKQTIFMINLVSLRLGYILNFICMFVYTSGICNSFRLNLGWTFPQEHEKRCWSVDFNLMDPKLLASGSDDAKGIYATEQFR